MTVVIKKSAVGLALKWAQGALFATSVLALGYCGFVFLDTWVFQVRQARNLERMLRDTSATLPEALPAVGRDGLIGRIEVPRLGVSLIVVEGTGESELRRAAGHIAGTALPGQPGNAGIAGHRDTLFRPLRNIKRGDRINVTTLAGEYRYRVVSTKIVDPDDVAVLKSGKQEILTLVTCYPFYFVGPAPGRFIVRAERVKPDGTS
jgi:sortase A